MKQRRVSGQISIQINWIFVLIVGAIILGFFITVINNQERRSSAEQATELVEAIDNIFTTISTNPNTIDTFTIRNANVEFTCEPGLSNYYIQGAGPVDTTHRSLYSSTTLRGSTIATWTRTLYVPFEATTLTYLADDRTVFLFVKSTTGGLVERLHGELPEAFAKMLVDPGNLANLQLSAYQRVVIIAPDDITFAPPQDAHVRIIPSQPNFDDVFTVRFAQGTNDVDSSVFTEQLLWAAIFAEDKEYYECNTRKALTRIGHLTSILHNRTATLKDETHAYDRCYDFLTSGATTLNTLKSGLTAEISFSPLLLHVKEANDKLVATHKLIQRGGLCPYIY